MLSIKTLNANFGAEITGVNLCRELSEELMQAIVTALHDHQVIVIRDQDLDPHTYVHFATFFGTPHPHILRHLTLPECPEVMPLSNVLQPGEPEELANGGNYWHTDQSYDPAPASVTMLHALKVPARGGETYVANMCLAYDALPDERKRQLDGLIVHHARDNGKKTNNLPTGNHDQAQRPTARHPLVRSHPATGRKGLYAITGTAEYICGMDRGHSDRLLEELARHALKEQFVYRHRYKVGDLFIMDTAATLHCAAPLGPARDESEARLLHRISTKGLPILASGRSRTPHGPLQRDRAGIA